MTKAPGEPLSLTLAGTLVTDAGLAHLGNIPNLERVNLSGTEITDAGLMRLETLTQLKTLRLGQTDVTDEGMKRLQKALPKAFIAR
jgi:hypothetical protein